MSESDWNRVLAALSPNQPTDIDADLLFEVSAPVAASRVEPARTAPSPNIWSFASPITSFFGVRVLGQPTRPEKIAARLAACAIEREVIPIVLKSEPFCGLELFGVRTEYVGTPSGGWDAELIAEVTAFWDLAIVVDLNEVDALK